MPKRRRKQYKTDVEAGALAQTARHPANLEETQQADANPAETEADVREMGEVRDPVRFCLKCQRPALPDPRGTHHCARCRSEKTG